jgi:energy-coupling factor transporter transmembrane protein EcfT
MTKNVGRADQWIRIIIGALLILWGLFGLTGTGKWVAIVVGFIPLLTAFIGFCPLYTLIGVNTRKE